MQINAACARRQRCLQHIRSLFHSSFIATSSVDCICCLRECGSLENESGEARHTWPVSDKVKYFYMFSYSRSPRFPPRSLSAALTACPLPSPFLPTINSWRPPEGRILLAAMAQCITTPTATQFTTITTDSVSTSFSESITTLPAQTSTITTTICATSTVNGTAPATSCAPTTILSTIPGQSIRPL